MREAHVERSSSWATEAAKISDLENVIQNILANSPSIMKLVQGKAEPKELD